MPDFLDASHSSGLNTTATSLGAAGVFRNVPSKIYKAKSSECYALLGIGLPWWTWVVIASLDNNFRSFRNFAILWWHNVVVAINADDLGFLQTTQTRCRAGSKSNILPLEYLIINVIICKNQRHKM